MRNWTRRGLLPAAALLALALPVSSGLVPSSTAHAAPRVTTPEQFFGFTLGSEGRLARWADMVRYYKLVADRSERVLYQEIGKTATGKPFPVLTVSSPANLAKLDRIKQINRRLADPRGLTEAQARKLAAEGRPVYLLEAAIHSTEVGTAQVIPNILHRLADEKSTTVTEILDNIVLLIIPAQSPDGTEWVGDYFDQTAGTTYARTYPDLYQKYIGHDDNRDWFMFTQPETKLSVALQNDWKPQVVQNLHQMGSGGARIFIPPYLSPNDPNIDPITVQQTNSLGMEMSRSLTAEGKKGVTWGSTYDYWTPSRQYMTYHGAPRILVEAASARDLAYTYTSSNGGPIGPQQPDTNFIEPYDQSSWSLAQIVDYLDTTVFAGLSNVAKYRAEWLFNFYRTQRNAVNPGAGKPYGYIVPADQRDPFATYELLTVLRTGEVEIEQATAPFTANGKRYDAGSWIIRYAQPYGRFAKTLLEVQHYPDLREYPGGPPQSPYDVTAQTLPMLLGVRVDTVAQPFSASTTQIRTVRPASPPFPAQPGARGAYLVGPESYGTAMFIAALQKAGVRTLRASAEFSSGGRAHAPGTLIVEPTAEARAALREVSRKTGVPVHAVGQAPRVAAERLKDGTRIGLYRGINNIPGGWMKWLFEQYGIGFTEVVADDFTGDLNAKYDTIVLPAGISRNDLVAGLNRDRYPAEWSWAYGVGEAGWAELRRFVEDGGTLLAIGDSVATARQLANLPITPALPSDEHEFYSPGSILSQRFDTSDPVAWGMRPDTPVWFGENDQAYTVSAGDVVSSFPESGEQLQSGWLIGGEHLNGKANVVKHRVGAGLIVTFGSEPTFRTWSRDPSKLLFNAIYHGPSTSVQPSAVPAALLGG
ncbi:M14 family zinc carboxypeptidase [Micromonospora globbae]|uniref:M14 family zinc carboxypeptidase n=1 Tax=Micromonospora globbae TaxID=1894969 RepID=A0ABZ1S0E9_9ACTN|nr:M14 family zinc carboxypeptidase [Micromonospora globbae]